jgi:choline kinase
MGDHLFESSILERLAAEADLSRLNLAIDRKVDSIFDLEDAMKVRTRDNVIVAIGKTLENYDAIDTGIFVCPEMIFDYLRRARRDDDCSLADGVRLMAEEGNALAVDIGAAWWQDVDTPAMLARAEQETMRLRERRALH